MCIYISEVQLVYLNDKCNEGEGQEEGHPVYEWPANCRKKYTKILYVTANFFQACKLKLA